MLWKQTFPHSLSRTGQGSSLCSTVSFIHTSVKMSVSLYKTIFTFLLSYVDSICVLFIFASLRFRVCSRVGALSAACQRPAQGAYNSAGETTFMENKGAGKQYDSVCNRALNCLLVASLQKPREKRSDGLSWWKWHLLFCPSRSIPSSGAGPTIRPSRHRSAKKSTFYPFPDVPPKLGATCCMFSFGQVAITSN